MRITKENFNSHLVSKDGIRKILSPAYLGAKEYEDTGRTGGKKNQKTKQKQKNTVAPPRCLSGEEIFKPTC